MKIITISGPTNAGKDSVIEQLQKELGQQVKVAQYYTTRKYKRPNETTEDSFFISDDDFNQKVSNGEFLFYGKNADYQVGTPFTELMKAEIVIANIALQFVEKLREYVSKNGGKVFSIFLTASKKDRIERHRLREKLLTNESSEIKINNDITPEKLPEGVFVDLIVENKEGKFKEAMAEILPKVKEFIES